MNIVLVDPEIPWNTGNIGRTCVATGSTLHLVGRLGFRISGREIRRSGLDYWPKLKLFQHESFEAFEESLPAKASILFFATQAKASFWGAPYRKESYLVFGSESRGLPPDVLLRNRDRSYRIPVNGDVRSLNLSTAAAVVLYEALRKTAGNKSAN